MSYNSTTGVITAPVSIKDVGDALGVPSGDLGTLCKSNTINKWSIRKPQFLFGLPNANSVIVHIERNLLDTIGAGNYKAVYAGILDGYYTLYGLIIPVSTDIEDYWYNKNENNAPVPNDSISLARFVAANYYTYAWGYLSSSTNNRYGYRLTDFDGYDHNAPSDSFIGFQTYVKINSSNTVGDTDITSAKEMDGLLVAGSTSRIVPLLPVTALVDGTIGNSGYQHLTIDIVTNIHDPLNLSNINIQTILGHMARAVNGTYVYLVIECINTTAYAKGRSSSGRTYSSAYGGDAGGISVNYQNQLSKYLTKSGNNIITQDYQVNSQQYYTIPWGAVSYNGSEDNYLYGNAVYHKRTYVRLGYYSNGEFIISNNQTGYRVTNNNDNIRVEIPKSFLPNFYYKNGNHTKYEFFELALSITTMENSGAFGPNDFGVSSSKLILPNFGYRRVFGICNTTLQP